MPRSLLPALACSAIGALAPIACGEAPPATSQRTPPPTAAARVASLKLATWNLEWLVAPEEMRRLRERCSFERERPREGGRLLPCDVAVRLERSALDYAALARYARELDADVVALQEVDGPQAARLVFPGYGFCFTSRRDLQNTGFAIRNGIPYRCGPDLRSISLNDRVRRGAELVLYPGERREIRLLSVHLKSGCGTRLLDDPRKDCMDLARQVAPLEAWIDEQARAGRRFAVLGDFNRDLLREQGPARRADGRLQRLWPEIDDSEPRGADLVNVAERERFLNCATGQAFAGYIDHIVLGVELARALMPGSFQRLTYRAGETRRFRLSDHCPIAVRVRLD